MSLTEIGRAPTWFARFLTRGAIGVVGHVSLSPIAMEREPELP